MTHYQNLLLNSDSHFYPPASLNSANLLPDPDCQQVLAEARGWHKDLSDQPLPDAEITWFTDGSSFIQDGVRYARAAGMIQDKAKHCAGAKTGYHHIHRKPYAFTITHGLYIGKEDCYPQQEKKSKIEKKSQSSWNEIGDSSEARAKERLTWQPGKVP